MMGAFQARSEARRCGDSMRVKRIASAGWVDPGSTVRLSERRLIVVKAADDSRRLRNREAGATVVEYVLLLALIAMVCVVGIQHIGDVNALFFSIGNTL
jgi:Flp pilus assembly pilin Flp